jgi:nicotinamidase-related amidase
MGNIVFKIDVQQDFFSGGSIDIPNNESILDNLKLISEFCDNNNIKTINTLRWFKSDSDFFSELPDYNKTFPNHCVKDTKGARFINQVVPKQYFLLNWDGGNLIFPEIHNNNNIVVTKKTIDVFEGNQFFDSLIHNLGVPMMERPHYMVYGVDVGTTVLGLLRRGYTVTVIKDATINCNGQTFKKEDIIKPVASPDPDIKPKDDVNLNFITSSEFFNLWKV